MRAYIIRRLLLMIPTLLLVTFIVFFLVRFMTGDIIDVMLTASGGHAYIGVDRAELEREFGLDVSVLEQYGRWMGVVPQADGSVNGIFQGDLGASWRYRMTVVDLVANKWPVTLELGIMGIIIAQLIALPIGVYSALRQDKWGDYIGRSFAILCISVPAFWVATLVIIFPSIWWGYMPPIVFIPFTENPIGNLKMFIVPAIILGMAMAGMTMRMTRSMMLEVLRQDYIRTAWSKGLKEHVITLRHTLRNALIPIITIVGLQMVGLIGGTVIIEQIFCLPGMGRLLLDATRQRDYPLISGIMLLFGVFLVMINLMVDLTYGFLDPRVHYK